MARLLVRPVRATSEDSATETHTPAEWLRVRPLHQVKGCKGAVRAQPAGIEEVLASVKPRLGARPREQRLAMTPVPHQVARSEPLVNSGPRIDESARQAFGLPNRTRYVLLSPHSRAPLACACPQRAPS